MKGGFEMNLKKSIILGLLVLAIAVPLMSILQAQVARGTLWGIVTRDSGDTFPPAAGVTVHIYLKPTLQFLPEEYIGSATTNAEGLYSFVINPIHYPVGGVNGYSRVIIVLGNSGYSASAPYSYGVLQLNGFIGRPK
jgi:hypothetical protein